MKKMLFNLRQLLPLTYYSKYKTDGKYELAIWRQWFGKPFSIKRYSLTV